MVLLLFKTTVESSRTQLYLRAVFVFSLPLPPRFQLGSGVADLAVMGGAEVIFESLALSLGHPEGGRRDPPPRPSGSGTMSSARLRTIQGFPGPDFEGAWVPARLAKPRILTCQCTARLIYF